MSCVRRCLPVTATLLLTLSLSGPALAQPSNQTEITSLTFTPDGKAVLSTGLDGALRRWDSVTGKETQSVDAHKGGAWGGALAPDGKRIATVGVDETIRVWDAATLKEVKAIKGHRGEVVAVAWSPDGKTLASGGMDKTIRFWDAASGKETQQFHGHELRVTSLSFAPDGKTLLSGGMGNVVIPGFFINAQHSEQACLWDVATGKQVRQLTQRGTQVAFAADGQTVATGGMVIVGTPVGGGVSINGGNQVSLGGLQAGRAWVDVTGQGGGFAFSADGKWLATTWGTRQHIGRFNVENTMKHRKVALWEVATGKEALQLDEDGACVVALVPDGTRLAAGRVAGGVQFYDLKPANWKAADAAKLTAQDLEKHWGELTGADAARAYVLLWTLAAAGEKAVTLLKERVQPVPPGGAAVAKLIERLDGKTFKERENAFKELKKLGAQAEPDLRVALTKKLSDEARQRVLKLLEVVGTHPASPEEVRQTRALQILEMIGSADARALLTAVADGAPGAWLTTEAQGCLRRLQARGP